ncbi:MAG: gliding motility-associated C-terminal domain-containing protein [Saprospiraceae bacterium]|nr:gliding motility-associated C-terminal domain-containing protein [Saprospiraceae bacterium]
MKHIITRSRTITMIGIWLLFCVSTSLAQNCNFTITVPDDITLCNEGFVNLNGQITGDYLNFHWNSTNGYYNDQSLNPNVWVTETTTFTLAAGSNSTTNLINNGDFEDGATGFTTQYALTFPGYTCPNGNQVWGMLGCEGTYFVGPSSSAVHTNFANCTPHGGSNMMMLNGANSLQELWCQTITVMPNTDYVFQAFATSIESSSPAILQFAIDGTLLGSPFALSGATCNWQEFYEIWNSGASTSIEICITNQNTAVGGNDFALDDIFFGPICKDSMDFTVYVSEMEVEPPSDGVIDCTTPVTLLEVLATPAGNNYQYEWNTSNGVIESDPSQASIEVSAAGLYQVTVTDELGCSLSNFAYVDAFLDEPVLDITGDDEISCAEPAAILEAGANEAVDEFVWTLPDGSQTTGIEISTTIEGWHFLEAQNIYGCTGVDSFYVSYLNTQFVYDVQVSGPLSCSDSLVTLHINSNSLYDSIGWSGPGIVMISSDQTTAQVNTAGNYQFTFYYGESCYYTDVTSVTSIAPAFQYSLLSPDTLDCHTPQVDLTATLSNGNTITWSYEGLLLPGAVADTIGVYHAIIRDAKGCLKQDSIVVAGNYALPSATVTVDTVDCITNSGSFLIDTTSAVTWLWSGPGGQKEDQMLSAFSVDGFYTLVMEGKNGCRDSVTYHLPSDINFPSLNFETEGITCASPEGKIDILSSLPSNIRWQRWDGLAGTGNQITTQVAGNYTIWATTPQGCEAQAVVVMPIDTLSPVVSAIVSDTLNCSRSFCNPAVAASGYLYFKWQGPAVLDSTLLPAFGAGGLYTLTLTGANGCKKSTQVSVPSNYQKPKASVQYADLSCKQPVTELIINEATAYKYQLTHQNNTQSIGHNHNLTETGSYTLLVTAPNGCDTSLAFTVKGHFEKPDIDIRNIHLDCYQPIEMASNQAVITDIVSYEWKVANGIKTTPSVEVTQAGIIELTLTNEWGCISADTAFVTVDFVPPAIQLSPERTILCSNSDLDIQVTNYSSSHLYSWRDSLGTLLSSLSTIKVTKPGTLELLVINTINGCRDSVELILHQQGKPEEIKFEVEQAVCFGDQASVNVNNISGGQAPYAILCNEKSLVTGKDHVLDAGNYVLSVVDKNGCQTDTQLVVDAVYPFEVYAGPDTVIQLFSTYQLEASYQLNGNTIDQLVWHANPTLSCTACESPVASPEGQTSYIVELTNQNGCIDRDTVTLRVRFDKGVTYPNIIRFDQGGNHRFTLYNKYASIDRINFLRIYDRWGTLVFVREQFPDSQPDLGWDGSFNGRPLVPGVYVWVAEIVYKDGSEEALRGDVTVVR